MASYTSSIRFLLIVPSASAPKPFRPLRALELLAVSPASGWHGGCRYLGAAPLFAPPNDREQGETRQVGLPALMDQEKGCHGADNAPHPRQWTTEVVYGRYR